MYRYSYAAGAVFKSLLLGLLALIALAFLATTGGSSAQFAQTCSGFFDAPALQNTICAINLQSIWNTPVLDLIPGAREYLEPLTARVPREG